MTQQTSPFIEGKFGWALGESNWNLGMDENLLKFSYLFDRNIDGIVSSLPAPVNGEAYFNTTDNRIYYAVNGVFSSTPVPKWFEITLRTSGDKYVFNGSALVLSNFVTEVELAATTGADLVGYMDRTQADKNADFVSVKDYGAVGDGTYHPLSDEYGSLAAAQIVYPFVTSLSQSLDWAGVQSAINSGRLAYVPAGVYVCTDELFIDNSTDNIKGLIGEGVDVWEQLFQSLPKKNSSGTHFIMYGMGVKTRTCEGVTDNAASGGAFANPEPVDLDTAYSLKSFHNNDASNGVASTLKPFSCGIYIAPGSRNIVLGNFRIHPWYDGINGYNNAGLTGLGDEWDVGICNDNSPDVWIDNVQSVGYWRIAGMFQNCTTRTGVQGASYQCRYSRINFQGRVGMLLRGGDTYRMLQRTASTVDIPWQDSHPFPNSGSFNTNSGTFPYTSTSKVLDGTFGNVLRFSGVVGDTSGVSQVRIASGFGIGGTSFENFLITGLEHTSGNKSSSSIIGLGVSTALEISGGFRQPFFSIGYVQSNEDVLMHLHNVDDMRMINTQLESNGRRGRLIASPQDINNTRVPYANGSTSITLIANHAAGADEFPLVSRADTGNLFTGAGFWQPRRIYNQDRQYPDSDQVDLSPMLTQHLRLNLAPNMQAIFRNSVGSNLFTINEATGNTQLVTGQFNFPTSAAAFMNAGSGQVFNLRHGTTARWQMLAAGHWAPATTADNTLSLGQANARVASSYVVLRYFTATVFDSAGTGSPEGVVTAGISSIYRQTDGASGNTNWRKNTGTGNTGWVLLS